MPAGRSATCCGELAAPMAGGANQPIEQPPEPARRTEVLRVPLHADAEDVAVVGLDRLDHAIAGARGDVKAGGDRLHRLVVAAVDGDNWTGGIDPEQGRERRSRSDVDLVGREVLRLVDAVGERLRNLGRNVLHERAARGDVQY